MARTPSQKELAAFVVAHGITDFVSGGKLSLIERNAIWKAISKLGPPVAKSTVRTIPRLAGTAIGGARFIAMRHPYVAGAVITYEVVKNREEIAALAREGWEIIEPYAQPVGEFLIEGAGRAKSEGIGQPIGSPFAAIKRKKKSSKFNKAVSKGMGALKRSKFMGKPGKFTNSKKAFGTVTRTVSRLKRGGKVSSKGALGTIKRAVKRLI